MEDTNKPVTKAQPFRVHPTLTRSSYELLEGMAQAEGCSISRMAAVCLETALQSGLRQPVNPEPNPT
jgi:hypothetical protein